VIDANDLTRKGHLRVPIYWSGSDVTVDFDVTDFIEGRALELPATGGPPTGHDDGSTLMGMAILFIMTGVTTLFLAKRMV
jgi:hypothetical protein